MIRKCLVVGNSVHDVYDWLSTNYPLENVDGVKGFSRDHDWCISNYSMKATIEWFFPRGKPVSHDIVVTLTNEQQLVLFKLRFSGVILSEYQ